MKRGRTATLRSDGVLKTPPPTPVSIGAASRPLLCGASPTCDERRVARAASGLAKDALTVDLLRRERGREIRPAIRVERAVIARVAGHHRAGELRQRPSNPVPGDVRRPEGRVEQRWHSTGVTLELDRERVERHPHLAVVLDRVEHLILERGGALVPEEAAAFVEARVGQPGGVSRRQRSREADAEHERVREAERLDDGTIRTRRASLAERRMS